MRLVQLKVRNFRAYRDENTLEIEKLTALIGRNDVGKSSLLEAIGAFFGAENCKLDAQDRCVRAKEDEPVAITCVFADLPPKLVLDDSAETSLASEMLLNAAGHLEILKEFSGDKMKEDVFAMAEHPTVADAAGLLEMKNADLKKLMKGKNLDADQRSNVAMREALRSATGDLKPARARIPLSKEGGKQIWSALGPHLPLFALFRSDRPSRDDDGEVQDPMRVAIKAAIGKVQPELQKVVQRVEQEVKDVASRTLERIAEIDDKLSSTLKPEFKADPKWDTLFKLSLTGDESIPINKRGSGVRRLVLLGFFQAEAERKRELAQHGSIIYAIEEPETSQHPTNQVALIEALKDLSENDGCQVLLTTHVPALASMLPIKSIRHITGDKKTAVAIATGEGILKAIANDLGVIPDWQDVRTQVIVCVEGPTDIEFLKNVAGVLRKHDATLPGIGIDSRIATIPLGGGTLKAWVNRQYLAELRRPEVHIYDNDVSSYQDACDLVNARGDGSWAVLTVKREFENYMHPDALKQVIGHVVPITDTDDVEALVFQATGQRRFNRKSIKAVIAEDAAALLTKEMLDERNATAEITSWLKKIGSYLR